jgi:hypothetical protein
MPNEPLTAASAKGDAQLAREATADKRKFFRLDRDVILDVSPISRHQALTDTPAEHLVDKPYMPVLEAFSALDSQWRSALAQIQPLAPDTHHALTLLNAKLDLLAKQSVFESLQQMPKTRISLSLDGIAFKHPKYFYKDSYLLLSLIFLPHFASIATFGQIVRCEPRDTGFNVAARFFRLTADCQSRLSAEITRAQQAASNASV